MKPIHKRNCLFCWNEFIKKKTVSMNTWVTYQKYCSKKCWDASRAWRQTPWNKWTKWICKAWNKWIKSPETSWNKNSRWTWTDDKYWKDKCKERDNFTCVQCWFREDMIMQVDHIKQKSEYPELRYCLENLQTLCPNCHARKTILERKNNKV